jgi:hypothetical protein
VASTSNDILRLQSTTGGPGNSAGIDFCTFSTLTSKVARIAAVDVGYFNGELAFYTDNDNVDNANVVERMRINKNGNVGIGTASPVAKLDVHLENPSGWGGNLTALNVSSPDNGYYLNLKTYVVQSGNAGYQFSPNGNTGMVITTPGYVGIGTTNPDYPLTVNGGAHVKEVRVDINIPGPDYVFEKDYQLTSLEEIKNYIDQNKHLPEVPSAKEMEKDGVQLGEMNMLLLKKIEELTLYVIEQNKKIDQQQKDIETLKTK